MANGWKVTAITFMVATAIFFIFWMYAAQSNVILNNEWAYEYEDLNEDWCEIFNDYSEVYNQQLLYLKEYDYELWWDSEEVEEIDCEE